MEGNGVDHSTIVTIAIAGIGGIVWLVRLEGRVNHNSKLIEYEQRRIDVLSTKIETIDSKIMEELASLQKSVARIEGYLKKANEGDDR